MVIVESQPSALAVAMQWPWRYSATKNESPLRTGRCRALRRNRGASTCNWQHHGEYGAASGRRSSFYVSLIFLQDSLADAQAKAGPAPRSFRGVERVEDVWQNFRRDPRPIILKGSPHRIVRVPQPNANCAAVARFPNGLLGIEDEIQEHLHQLMGIAHHGRQPRLTKEIDGDIALA